MSGKKSTFFFWLMTGWVLLLLLGVFLLVTAPAPSPISSVTLPL